MKIGLTFNLYLNDSGDCYIHGRLTDMDGDNIVDYEKPTGAAFVWQMDEKKFIQIATGYNHVVLLSKTGKVYVWGMGTYGQLGMTNEVRNLFDPYPILDLCSETSKITQIFATANHSFAVSNLGITYHWGLMEASKEDIIWSPVICHADDSAGVVDIGGHQHEIIIIDQNGMLSICKLTESSREFRPMNVPFDEEFRSIAGCGIGHQIFIKPFLVPEKCIVELLSTSWISGKWNSGKLKLFSNIGPYSISKIENLRLSLYFSATDNEPATSHDYQLYLDNVVEKIEVHAETKSIIRSHKKAPRRNDIDFDCQIRVSELEPNEVMLEFCTKQTIGKYYLHVLISEENIPPSPINVEIQQGQVDRPKAIDEIKMKAIMDRKREAEERQRKLEEQLKLKREREIAEEQRRKLTEKRAEEALKALKLKIKEQEKKISEERKKRLELITGGGFNLSKLKKE